MTDWTTVAIALITGSAGVAGSLINSLFQARSTDKSHYRDDANTLRAKLEEFAIELDEASFKNAIINSTMLRMLNGTLPKDNPTPAPVNLGKIRALVIAYFPECHSALEGYDAREVQNIKVGRERAEAKGADVVLELQSLFLLSTQNTNQLLQDLRGQFAAIGARVSLNPSRAKPKLLAAQSADRRA